MTDRQTGRQIKLHTNTDRKTARQPDRQTDRAWDELFCYEEDESNDECLLLSFSARLPDRQGDLGE